MGEWQDMTKDWTILQKVYYIGSILLTFVIGTLIVAGMVGELVFLCERWF